MRAWELLKESTGGELVSDLEDLLIAAKATGIYDIESETLVDQLNSMGYSVTPDSLLDVMDELDDEFVQTATLKTITLKSHTADSSGDDENEYGDEEADAGRIATKTAMKGVKKSAKQKRKTTKDAQL